MSKSRDGDSAAPTPGVINLNPPAKRDLVERALSDGMTDPAKIVTWAKNYKVSMTLDEVKSLALEINKPKPRK